MKKCRPSMRCLLRHKIVIQQETHIADTLGGYERGWEDVTSLWAKVSLSSGRERLFGEKLQTQTTHVFGVRYQSGIHAGMRILFDNRIFNIRYIHNIDEQKRLMDLVAEEGVG